MRTPIRLVCVVAAALAAPIAVAESLLDIYQKALTSDPLLREAQSNRLATLENKPQAIGALLPQASAGVNYDDLASTGARVSTFGGVPAITEFDNDTDGWSWNVQVRQTLFSWDQWTRLKQADKEVAQAEVDYLAAEQDLMTRVAIAYFDVLAAQDTLASEQAAKEAIGRQLEQAQKRFEVGLIAITDVQEAQAGYDQAVAAEIVAKRALANQREVLREITGEYMTDLASPQETIPLLSPDPADEASWVEVALQQNPALLSADLGAEISRDDVRIAQSGHLPTVDLVLSHSDVDVSGNGTSFNPATGIPPISSRLGTDSADDSITVQFSIPLFSGGTTSSQAKAASYRHRAAKERLERVARETERQTRDSYLGVMSEISRVKALKQALASANTALKATEAGFEVGTRTTVDVLDARRALFVAETNYARSRYDYIVNVLRLKQAAGILAAGDIVEVNGWLQQ